MRLIKNLEGDHASDMLRRFAYKITDGIFERNKVMDMTFDELCEYLEKEFGLKLDQGNADN